MIDVLGVIISFWDERGAVNQTIFNEIGTWFPNKLLSSKIRRDIAVSRAVFHGETITEFAPESRAAEDYQALTKEIVSLVEQNSSKQENTK